MDGWRCSRLESNKDKAVDREDERQRAMETDCWGTQGWPRAVAPRGRKEERKEGRTRVESNYRN